MIYRRALCFLLRGLPLTLALLVSSAVQANEVALMLIANPPDGQALDTDYALSLLRGESKNWDGGTDARVVLPSREAPGHELVARHIFDASGTAMQRLWFRLVFSGRVNAPTYLDSDEAIIRFVRENPGAVGVVAASDSPLDGVRTAAVTP